MKADLEDLLKNPRFAEILDRAAAVYSRSGYNGSSIRDVAAALDIKSASLYHYFTCKEDILYAIIWRFYSNFLADVTPKTLLDGPPDEVMRDLVDTHIRFDSRHWNDMHVSLRERNSLSAERRSVINNMRRQHRHAVAALVSRGASAGSWAASEPAIVGSTILDMINGLVQWYRPRGEADLAHIIAIYGCNAAGLMSVQRDGSAKNETKSATKAS